MPTVELEPRYFERMGRALGDKARMVLPHLLGPRVLDVGAGGGELTRAIAGAGFGVSALDAAPDAVARLTALGTLDDVRRGYAEQVPQLFPDPFDSIVVSAVLHEVYSYGTSPETGPPLRGFDALTLTLTRFREGLRDGGRLIVRDGVMPDRPLEPATVDGLSISDIEAYRDYLRRSPHPALQALHLHGRSVAGTRHAVAEFLFTLTWGIETFPREALERYQLFTLAGYGAYAGDLGFDLLHSEVVTQPGYVDALARLRVTSDERPWFPATNGLWVFERRASADATSAVGR
jgi:SAM-dependent methyltransferase